VILIEKRGKYIVYDKNGKLVIITRDKRVAIAHARSLLK
tara:strand:+ start:516 stop:632 length:117 start_codon:yes stop_codon:yes gene_type:complete